MQTLDQKLDNVEDYDGNLLEGIVIDNDDPDGLDRVRALIPGVYDTIEDCVWIGPAKKSPFGQGTGYGVFGAPAIGSTLIVELQHGDPHYPIYHGSLMRMGHKTGDLRGKFHKDAWGFRDPTGNELVVDMKSGVTTFTHSSQIVLTFAGGTFTVTTPQDTDFNVGGNANVNVRGDATLEAENITATARGTLTASAETASVHASDTASVSAGKRLSFNAPKIAINNG